MSRWHACLDHPDEGIYLVDTTLVIRKIALPCLPIPTLSCPSHPTLPVARSRPVRACMAVTDLATPRQSQADVPAVMAAEEFWR
jgi:hypothetical protein